MKVTPVLQKDELEYNIKSDNIVPSVRNIMAFTRLLAVSEKNYSKLHFSVFPTAHN